MRHRRLAAIFMISAACLLGAPAHASDNPALVKKHKKIVREFTDVRHVTGEDLLSQSPDDMIIFDVRERAEFEVSHIAGAVHVDPSISKEEFLQTYGDLARGKSAVFYCSVGQRSSRLADKVQTDLTQDSDAAVYNLEGGLFKWHNEGRPLQTQISAAQSSTSTPYIHPYNRYWGRMINDRAKTRYVPEGD